MASLLPVFSFLYPSVLDLGSGTGQTDGETDKQTLRRTDNRQTCRWPSMHYALTNQIS